MLQEVKPEIMRLEEIFEAGAGVDRLRALRTRITKETLAVFDPEKWREVFGPLDLALDLSDSGEATARHGGIEPGATADRAAKTKQKQD
jgi:hypothetical protein